MKSNLKVKIIFAILLVLILGVTTTFCYATDVERNVVEKEIQENSDENLEKNEENSKEDDENLEENDENLEEDNDDIEIQLNRKVTFIGKTYYFASGKKLFFKAVRKEYTAEEPGCGIIGIISEGKEFEVYIMGEGWISKEQILSSTKYIQLTFEDIENGKNVKINVDGEYMDVESDNDAIITYEDGELRAVTDGRTDVVITTKEGKKINVLAMVTDGEISLNIPEKSLTADMNVDATVVEKVKIKGDVASTTTLYVEEEGTIGLKNETNGTLDVNDKNIAEITTKADIEAKKTENGVDVTVNGEQSLTLLQRIAVALKEALTTKINEKGISDPTADLNVNILDKDIINVEDKTIPIFTTLKILLTKLISL